MRRLEDWQGEFPGTEDVRDLTVFDAVGKPIGRIEAAYLDTGSQGKIRFLLVAERLIPVDAIRGASGAGLSMDLCAEQVRASPPLPDERATLPESYLIAVYTHYGYTPHWQTDNIFPGYPES